MHSHKRRLGIVTLPASHYCKMANVEAADVCLLWNM